MGQYGNILKIDINQNSKKHFGVYVKYADPCEASIAILVKAIIFTIKALDQWCYEENKYINAFYGSTK